MAEKIRQIVTNPQDIFAELTMAYTLPASISEEDIAKFCKECDFSKAPVCSKVGQNDQARYAAREGCGWAEKDGVRGSMTADGFKS